MHRRSVLAVIAGLALVLGLQGSAGAPLIPGLVSVFPWRMDDPRFGGFSAIEVMPDGQGFVALSDRGAYTTGRFTRSPSGAIVGVTASPVALLRAEGDAPLRTARSDSEGLAIAPDGTVFVSFEGVARVLRYDRIDGPAINLPRHPDFARMPINGALEALAVDAAGTLYTLPERTGRSDRADRSLPGILRTLEGNPDGPDFPIYRFRDGAWDQPFALPRDETFLPVAADFGPDGQLYILERQFRGLAGFVSRLRRFAIADDRLTLTDTPLLTNHGEHDNLEGLSVWRDADGALRATMISDDNFRFYQRTEIVEYSLPDAP